MVVAIADPNRNVFAVDIRDHDLVVYVRDQLPRVLREKLTVTIESDAFYLRTRASFFDGTRHYECILEPQKFGDRTIACKIPDTFIAHLSAVL